VACALCRPTFESLVEHWDVTIQSWDKEREEKEALSPKSPRETRTTHTHAHVSAGDTPTNAR
jgi:hypothetical protein